MHKYSQVRTKVSNWKMVLHLALGTNISYVSLCIVATFKLLYFGVTQT